MNLIAHYLIPFYHLHFSQNPPPHHHTSCRISTRHYLFRCNLQYFKIFKMILPVGLPFSFNTYRVANTKISSKHSVTVQVSLSLTTAIPFVSQNCIMRNILLLHVRQYARPSHYLLLPTLKDILRKVHILRFEYGRMRNPLILMWIATGSWPYSDATWHRLRRNMEKIIIWDTFS